MSDQTGLGGIPQGFVKATGDNIGKTFSKLRDKTMIPQPNCVFTTNKEYDFVNDYEVYTIAEGEEVKVYGFCRDYELKRHIIDEYDDNGRIVKTLIDDEDTKGNRRADGIADTTRYYEYDSNGNETVVKTYCGSDGTIDEIRYNEYDSNGNKTDTKYYFAPPKELNLYEYDDKGRLVKKPDDE